MPSFSSLPGFRDFYPPEFSIRSHITNAWREVARRYGFEEYDGPPLEALELYTAKSGDEIVGQLYNFEDKGGRAVAMRPEMTPTFARMVGARLNEQGCVGVDAHQRTSVPGLYAAGDVVIGLDQISHAMGEGGVAATTIRNDLAKARPLLR